MAHRNAAERVVYRGEIWTDGRGFATVHLPLDAEPLLPPLEYELHDLEPQSSARVTGELKDGRFTIETEQPHVKVAWRLTGRRSEPQRRQTT
jgi:hypothetical protein